MPLEQGIMLRPTLLDPFHRRDASVKVEINDLKPLIDRTHKTPLHPRKAIPKMARAPDVFQDPSAVPSTSRLPFTTPVASTSKPVKRVGTPITERENAAKRPRKETPNGAKKTANAVAMEEWKSKYTKAFPQFVFHFEYDAASQSRAKGLKTSIELLGGRVDQFFSKKVTHLVTLKVPVKPAPLTEVDVNEESESQRRLRQTIQGPGADKYALPCQVAKVKALPRSPEKNPFVESGAIGAVTDLASKAALMNMKIWPISKLQEVLRLLCPVEEPVPLRNELSQLLEDERLNGTRERDTYAPRHDHYYFARGNHYLLIEDALGQHRPVMAKEYDRTANRDETQWPVLHNDYLRIPESVKLAHDGTQPSQRREKAWRMYVSRVGWKGEVAPLPHGEGSLRRSNSIQSFDRQSSGRLTFGHALPTPPPYQAASGNSVALTSNINSTCDSKNHSRSSLEGGLSALAGNKDKRVFQLSKRVQVLKSNVSARMAAGKTKLGAANGLEGADDELEVFGRPRAATMVTEMKPDRRFKSQKEVLEILKLSRRSVPIPDEVSRRERQTCRDHAMGEGASLLGDKSGYCENCRSKFENIETHAECRRHLRFVADAANWVELDEILNRVARLRRRVRQEDYHRAVADAEGLLERMDAPPPSFADEEAEAAEWCSSAGSEERFDDDSVQGSVSEEV